MELKNEKRGMRLLHIPLNRVYCFKLPRLAVFVIPPGGLSYSAVRCELSRKAV